MPGVDSEVVEAEAAQPSHWPLGDNLKTMSFSHLKLRTMHLLGPSMFFQYTLSAFWKYLFKINNNLSLPISKQGDWNVRTFIPKVSLVVVGDGTQIRSTEFVPTIT